MKTILLIAGWVVLVVLLTVYFNDISVWLSDGLGRAFPILNTELPITGNQLRIILAVSFSAPLPILWIASKLHESS